MSIDQTPVINSFHGKYAFLSNAYPVPVKCVGITFQNAEAAYQALKYTDQEIREQFCDLDAREAKLFGRELEQKPDWDEWNQKKVDIMLSVVYAKFDQNPELQEKLLETGNAILVQGGLKNDLFWGVSTETGTGENYMGAILMHVRKTLKALRKDADQVEGDVQETED